MAVDTLTRPRHSWKHHVGIAAMVLLGAFGTVLALVGTWAIFYDYPDTTWITYGSVFTASTLAWAALLWLGGPRHTRACAAGVAGTWVVIVGLLWLDFRGSGMSEEETDHVIATLVSEGSPAYYFGDSAEGHTISNVTGERDTAKVYVDYGPCRGGPVGGEFSMCWPAIYVYTFPFSNLDPSRDDCKRLQPVLGVPAAFLDEGEFGEPVLTLFTGRAMILIAFRDVELGEAEHDLEREVTLARTLRPLGQSQAATALPPPDPTLRKPLDRACGTTPQ